VNFIEIGSCDYDTLLHNPYFCLQSWGIIVEPIKKYFDNLPQYPNVTYLNSAVTASNDGYQDFYAPIDEPDPAWVKSVGSLRENHPTLEYLGIRNQIVKTQVSVISLDTLYKHIPENKIHFLKIDTEGSDFEILSNWDFHQFKPMQIQFESKLMLSEELSSLILHLENLDYSVVPGNKKDYNSTPYNHIAILET